MKQTIDTLHKIWTALRMLFYVVIGFAPSIGGIYMIFKSQHDFFEKEHQETMHLSIGIISLFVGILVGYACFVRFVEIYRNF
jgi:uncharacterized membrane protein HdeD (DUF308 family)